MLKQVTFHFGISGLLIGGRNICGKDDEKGSSTGQVQLICGGLSLKILQIIKKGYPHVNVLFMLNCCFDQM